MLLVTIFQQDYNVQTLSQTLDQYDLDLETVTKNFHVANGILSDDQDLDYVTMRQVISYKHSSIAEWFEL